MKKIIWIIKFLLKLKKKKKLINETETKTSFKIKLLVTVGESLEGRIN